MAENPKQRFLSSLLAQDQAFSSTPDYQEYRVMLDQKLNAAERKAKNRWRITVGMWILTAVLFFGGFLLATQPFPAEVRPIGAMIMGVGSLMFYLSLLRLFIYLAF